MILFKVGEKYYLFKDLIKITHLILCTFKCNGVHIREISNQIVY